MKKAINFKKTAYSFAIKEINNINLHSSYLAVNRKPFLG